MIKELNFVFAKNE